MMQQFSLVLRLLLNYLGYAWSKETQVNVSAEESSLTCSEYFYCNSNL